MICPITALAIKGILFHQGFNNAFEGSTGADRYYQTFGKMITAWRSTFDDPDLPFGIISLCTAGTHQTLGNYVERMFDAGIYIREAQYKTFLDFYDAGDKHIGFASSFDKRRSWFHPTEKISVGERIASWALATQYGKLEKIHWLPPRLKEVAVKDGEIRLFFDTMVEAVSDNEANGFSVAGKDRRFCPATVTPLITGKNRQGDLEYAPNALVLRSPHVADPIHFRYAWGRNPMGNLVTEQMIPFATQRSDSWKLEEVPLPPDGQAEWQEDDLIRRELRLTDLERRLKDARAFIEEMRRGFKRRENSWKIGTAPPSGDDT